MTAWKDALRLCREIVEGELDNFIMNNSTPGEALDRKSLTGYELEELERLERAVAAADAALSNSPADKKAACRAYKAKHERQRRAKQREGGDAT